MNKPHIRALLFVLVAACLTACSTERDFAYIHDAERDSVQQILNMYNAEIRTGDQLYIRVDSQSPESVIIFNKETNRVATNLGKKTASKLKQKYQDIDGYTVSQNGTIEYPVLGEIAVCGVTLDSLADYIGNALHTLGYVEDPVVTVEIQNFRVAVLGEVKRPRNISIDGTRLTLFEALAMAGDITIHGQRESVTIIRTGVNNEAVVGIVDLSSKELLTSPFYYLQQNDIVYVGPSELKKKRARRDEKMPVYIATGINALALIRNITRIIPRIQELED